MDDHRTHQVAGLVGHTHIEPTDPVDFLQRPLPAARRRAVCSSPLAMFVLVQPCTPLLGVVQILPVRVRFAEVGVDIALASKRCEIAALLRDGCRLRVAGHLVAEDESNLARDLGGLPHEGVWSHVEGTALDMEAFARVHLPSEAYLAVLLKENSDAKKVGPGPSVAKVVASSPRTLGTNVFGYGGINCALVFRVG